MLMCPSQGSNVVTKWQKLQLFYQGILENGDKRTDNWLLVYSPVPITCIFLCYLITIWAGPKLMANRRPVNLKPVLVVYNFAMVCLSAYMFYEFTASSWLAGYSLLCQPVDYSNNPLALRMARVCWWFYFSKVIELSDTIFFILRKKNSQLTFLHVYHHATMIFNWWTGVKYVAGGQSAVFRRHHAHRLQSVCRLRLPRLHERCRVGLFSEPHCSLQ
ncbi:ELOVL fatty acid elongase 8a isoform X3 [Poecilia latipinna]|uniref:ELOVL fatty acid elongase 8a isoform X3 n=1 Tax=Poecilia latipinna TaxID=48699 RepID=UPI00072EDF88|nr:PREDICTED: elongation of very long chain fatty acids protein 7-like isoform X3 [Poecilia latipinna]